MLFSIGSRPMLGKSDLNDHRCLDPYRKLLEVLDLGQTMAASPHSATGHRNANLTQPPKESKSWSPQMEKDLEIRDFQVVTCMLLYQLFLKMCLVLVNFGGGSSSGAPPFGTLTYTSTRSLKKQRTRRGTPLLTTHATCHGANAGALPQFTCRSLNPNGTVFGVEVK